MTSSEKTYRNYLKIKDDFNDAMSRDWEETTGTGSQLIDDARQCIACVVLSDDIELDDIAQYVTDLSELITMLAEHEDDYVRVIHNPMGSWQIEDATI